MPCPGNCPGDRFRCPNQTHSLPLRPDEFRTVFRQATVWVEDYAPTVRQVLNLGMGPWAARFDDEPAVLPAEFELPPDLPRITIPSSNRAWRVEVGRPRVNVIWESAPGSAQISSDEFARAVVETVYPFLHIDERIRPVRLAFVVRRVSRTPEAARDLASFFVRAELLRGPLNRPEAFELHAYKAYEPAGMPRLNSWIRWRGGRTP
jgi:hypothetical protein